MTFYPPSLSDNSPTTTSFSALYSGNVFIWNYDSESIVRTFEVSEVPVRNAKFIERKNWFVCGTDDMHIRIYNYNTCEKVKEFEAHTDYIRCITVHPTLPFIMSASDDMSIKLWDWDNQWGNSIIFEGHTHVWSHYIHYINCTLYLCPSGCVSMDNSDGLIM